jgi:hypothetical protein
MMKQQGRETSMIRWPRRGLDAVAGAILMMCALASPAMAQVATSGPILPSERDTTQTPRTVAASEYRDSYCAKWTDGCSVCQRSTANDAPDCRPIGDAGAACERKAVECSAVLKTVWRVCLAYTDGCNQCAAGHCTAMGCGKTDYQCTLPRRSHYDEPNALKLDLRGHWRLVDPQGRTCEIVFGFGVPITGKCLELGPPVAQIREVAVHGTIFQLVRSGANAPLSFETTNLERLVGIGPATGYRLERLEPMPLFPFLWVGKWKLSTGSWGCDLYLSMRRHRLDPPGNGELLTPHDVSLSSICVSSTDETRIRLIYGGNKEVLFPIWKTWQVEGYQVTFQDDRGAATVFKLGGDGQWTAEVPRDGQPPLAIRLERARE